MIKKQITFFRGVAGMQDETVYATS